MSEEPQVELGCHLQPCTVEKSREVGLAYLKSRRQQKTSTEGRSRAQVPLQSVNCVISLAKNVHISNKQPYHSAPKRMRDLRPMSLSDQTPAKWKITQQAL